MPETAFSCKNPKPYIYMITAMLGKEIWTLQRVLEFLEISLVLHLEVFTNNLKYETWDHVFSWKEGTHTTLLGWVFDFVNTISSGF